MLSFIKVDDGLQAIVGNKSHRVSADHPKYDLLLEAIFAGDADTFLSNVTIEKAVSTAYKNTGVVVENGSVKYNGEYLHGVIVDRIIGFVDDGLPVDAMILFLKNLLSNPSKRAVDELYGFLEHESLPITEDGCFLAYKTVRGNYKDKYSGRFDNTPGQVLEMPRNKVDDNANQTCSHGFHVGALEYAGPSGWYNNSRSDKVVIVKVNPRDAVSVPTDHSAQKLRVCKYEVVSDYADALPSTYQASLV